MKKTRTLLAAAAAIAGLVALPGAAQAAPPQAQTFTIDLPGTNDPDVGDNGFCPFPVQIVAVTNQLTPITSPLTTSPDLVPRL
jgi:poly(3-hydroxybutyrate) depolymerase